MGLQSGTALNAEHIRDIPDLDHGAITTGVYPNTNSPQYCLLTGALLAFELKLR